MSVVAYTIFRPIRGKRAAAEARAKQAVGIFDRAGASAKATNFVAGPYSGCIGIMRGYSDFRAAAKTFNTLAADAEYTALQEKRETDPVAEVVEGRNIARRVYGEGKWSTHPVSHLRVYEISKANLAAALALFPEVEAMAAPADVNVAGLVPITGDNLSTLTVSYQLRSMEHWGEALDTIGTSEAFQAILVRAAELGTLRSSNVMVPL